MVIVFCYVEGIRPLVECIIHCVFWFAVEGKIIGTDNNATKVERRNRKVNDRVKG